MEKRADIIRSAITLEHPNWMKFIQDSFDEEIVNSDSFIINCQLDDEKNSRTFFQHLLEMRSIYRKHNEPHIICKNIAYEAKNLNKCMNWIDRKMISDRKSGLLLVTPYTLTNRDARCYWDYNELVGKVRDI